MKNSNETIVNVLLKEFQELRVRAVYRVGLIDDSLLSDIDIIIVADVPTKNITKRVPGNSTIDIRNILTPAEFSLQYLLFPYVELRLLWGEDLSETLSLPKDLEAYNVLRFATMCLRSFLRNFYPLRSKKIIPVNTLLTHLNDFSYVKYWVPNAVPLLGDFEQRVNKYRAEPESCAQSDARALLEEAIDRSWDLVGYTHELLARFPQFRPAPYSPHTVYGVFPTLCAPFTILDCRTITEKWSIPFPWLRILVFPMGFRFVYSNDTLTRSYVERNLLNVDQSLKARVAGLIRSCVLYVVYVLFLFSYMPRYFNTREAYASAVSSYTEDEPFLMEAELLCIEKSGVVKGDRILDVGCGTGRTTFPLIDLGYDVTGIDVSPDLINVAQSFRGGDCASQFFTLDLLDLEQHFQPEHFSLCFFSYNGIDYIHPHSSRVRALRIMHCLLKDEGFLVLSCHNSLCINRNYLKTYIFNLFNVITGRHYFVCKQSFGLLLTHFAPHYTNIKEIEKCGFKLVFVAPTVKRFFPFRDQSPYLLFKKI